jgi:hypothetical protein
MVLVHGVGLCWCSGCVCLVWVWVLIGSVCVSGVLVCELVCELVVCWCMVFVCVVWLVSR